MNFVAIQHTFRSIVRMLWHEAQHVNLSSDLHSFTFDIHKNLLRRLHCTSSGYRSFIPPQQYHLTTNKVTISLHHVVYTTADVVKCRPLTTEASALSYSKPCEIYGGQSSTGMGFSPGTMIFPCDFHSTNAPLSHFILLNQTLNNLTSRKCP
jgi:hypothetical protein